MVEADRYCVDVLTQISAVTKVLQSVAVALLEQKLTEATQAIERLLKS
jgi:DNA-binding FrmR family transcriptional regulator